MPSSRSPFYFAPVLGVVLLMVKVAPPTSINSIWKLPHRHAQKFISYVSLDPIKLTVNVDSHTQIKLGRSFSDLERTFTTGWRKISFWNDGTDTVLCGSSKTEMHRAFFLPGSLRFWMNIKKHSRVAHLLSSSKDQCLVLGCVDGLAGPWDPICVSFLVTLTKHLA